VVYTVVTEIAAHDDTASVDAESETCRGTGDIYRLEVLADSDESMCPEVGVDVISDELSPSIEPNDTRAHRARKINGGENAILQQESMLAEIGVSKKTDYVATIIDVESVGAHGTWDINGREAAIAQQEAMVGDINIDIAAHDVAMIVDSKELRGNTVRYINAGKSTLTEDKTMRGKLRVEITPDDLASWRRCATLSRMDSVLGSTPRLPINTLRTETEQSEQKGFANLLGP
jgi:hypothetical protein